MTRFIEKNSELLKPYMFSRVEFESPPPPPVLIEDHKLLLYWVEEFCVIEHIVYHPYPCTVRECLQIPSQEQHNSI